MTNVHHKIKQVESSLVACAEVSEAAVVGFPHEVSAHLCEPMRAFFFKSPYSSRKIS
jgi:hypothetical protein